MCQHRKFAWKATTTSSSRHLSVCSLFEAIHSDIATPKRPQATYNGTTPPLLRALPAANLWRQNALFNSALRQSTQIRKDLDQFADSAAPSPQLQAQLNASLATFSRIVDDYGKLAKQEPVQTKQEKAFERLKNFRGELDEYRESFKRIKSANEDIVRLEHQQNH